MFNSTVAFCPHIHLTATCNHIHDPEFLGIGFLILSDILVDEQSGLDPESAIDELHQDTSASVQPCFSLGRCRRSSRSARREEKSLGSFVPPARMHWVSFECLRLTVRNERRPSCPGTLIMYATCSDFWYTYYACHVFGLLPISFTCPRDSSGVCHLSSRLSSCCSGDAKGRRRPA